MTQHAEHIGSPVTFRSARTKIAIFLLKCTLVGVETKSFRFLHFISRVLNRCHAGCHAQHFEVSSLISSLCLLAPNVFGCLLFFLAKKVVLCAFFFFVSGPSAAPATISLLASSGSSFTLLHGCTLYSRSFNAIADGKSLLSTSRCACTQMQNIICSGFFSCWTERKRRKDEWNKRARGGRG